MLQFRHQTKQLCVVDVAHSIHLILGSSNKPIEVAPANPPNSPPPSTGPSSIFPTLGLTACSPTARVTVTSYAMWYATFIIFF